MSALFEALSTLSEARLEVVSAIVRAFAVELKISVDPDSDFADEGFAQALGDLLLVHHTLSNDAFSKDKFEHGLEAALLATDHDAKLATRGNPGHDITVDGVPWSLKTQADRSIKPDRIHISKFMELGKGRWIDEADLAALRDRMFSHMNSYERIFTLRCLSARRSRENDPNHEYELVEIPKELLRRSSGVACVMSQNSRQNPKPGTCTVIEDGAVLFALYFDGGTERKLQVKDLAVSACRVHATWSFPRGAPPS